MLKPHLSTPMIDYSLKSRGSIPDTLAQAKTSEPRLLFGPCRQPKKILISRTGSRKKSR